MKRFLAVLLVAIGLTGALTPPAAAQYFGRNKVQYKKLDFQVLKTEHFDIYFYPQFTDCTPTAVSDWPQFDRNLSPGF